MYVCASERLCGDGRRREQHEGRSLSFSGFPLLQVNEAFAPQFLAVAQELGLDPARTNVNGGAIALGHPLGASGARITTNLVHEIR